MISQLIEKIKKTNAPICVGLDPMLSYVPEHVVKKSFDTYGETLKGAAEAIWELINRLEQMLYRHRTPVKGWMAKQGYYRHPEEYEMMDGEWEELAEGIHVGSPDLTVFLKNHIVLDAGYKGETAVLLLKVGGEGCVSVNGNHYNGLDFNRNMILLSECAQGGEEYKVEIETYCKDLILDSDNVFKTDVVITQSEIAAINRPAWDFYFEVKTGFDFIVGCGEEYTRQRVLHVIIGPESGWMRTGP